jgi:hypothetical protein
MTEKTNDALSRSDRVLVAALAIILATASAAVGASLTNHAAAAKAAMAKPVTIKITPLVEAKLPRRQGPKGGRRSGVPSHEFGQLRSLDLRGGL